LDLTGNRQEMQLLLTLKSPSLLHCQTLDVFVVHNFYITFGTWAQTTENFTLVLLGNTLYVSNYLSLDK